MQETSTPVDRSRELQELLEAAAQHERLKLAQDLHDRVAQTLVALVMEVEGLRRRLLREGTVDEVHLGQIAAMAREALSDLRSLVTGLRCSGSPSSSLVERIKASLLELEQRTGIHTQFKVFGPRPRMPAEKEEALLRVVQEALNNVARHSHARRVAVMLYHRPEVLELLVDDDGIGISADARQRAMLSGRLGLMSMRERVLALGGTLEINTAPGLGTKVRIRTPLAERDGNRP
jgi:signal transduction histidine kinase